MIGASIWPPCVPERLIVFRIGQPLTNLLGSCGRLSENPEAARVAFRRLRQLRDQMRQLLGDPVSLPHLSMGMTNDFEVAIEEGATLIRIGTALFEGLAEPQP